MTLQNSPHDEWEANLIEYSLGLMGPGEADAFAAQLEDCRRRQQLVAEYQQVIGMLGAAPTAVEPPEGHKDRFMARVAATPQPTNLAEASLTMPFAGSPERIAAESGVQSSEPVAAPLDLEVERQRRRRRTLLTAVAAVAAAVVLFVGLWGWNAQSERLASYDELVRVRTQLALAQGRPNVPAGYKALQLPSADGYDGVAALVLYSPDTRDALFVADGLEPLPADRVYELWILQGQGDPLAAGTFAGDAAGTVTQQTSAPEPVGRYAGFAVTVERAPGVAKAEGPLVVAGKFTAP